MSDTYIIEIGSQPAGIIVRAPGGYQFFAATHRFNHWKGRSSETHARPSAPPGGLPAGCRWRRNRQPALWWSELGGAPRQQLPVVALLLPVHQDVQVLRRLLAVVELLLADEIEAHDRSRTDDANCGVLVFK
jgi:hypothetical protein